MSLPNLNDALAPVLARWPDCTVAVAVERLVSREKTAFHGDEPFHPCSTIKVVLIGALYDQVAQGKLSLDDKVTIHNGFPSSIDGSLYDLDKEDDSETTLYGRMGQEETLRELARLTIVRSSNLGTNLLMEKIPPATMSAYVAKIPGAEKLLFRNRMMDMKAFNARQTNQCTAVGLNALMAAIARKEVPMADDILKILEGQEFKSSIPAGLPPGTKVAHKTGSITAHSHDFGIIYPGDPNKTYILTVLTRGGKTNDDGHKLIADITRVVHAGMV